MDLTQIPANASDDEIRELILHDKTFAAAQELADVLDIERKRNESVIRREEKTVVTRLRFAHGARGIVEVREYLCVTDDGTLTTTESPMQAKEWIDPDEAHAFAERARRDLLGKWDAIAVAELYPRLRRERARYIDATIGL